MKVNRHKLIAAGILALTLTGCQSSQSQMSASDSAAIYKNSDNDMIAEDEESIETQNADPTAGLSYIIDGKTKRVYRGSISLTSRDVTKSAQQIHNIVNDNKGFIQNESNSGNDSDTQNSWITIRVPAENFDKVMEALKSKDLGTVSSSDIETDDISKQYQDTQTRITALKVQLERLNELMKQAENMEDILAIEDKITQVQGELDMYEQNTRDMDDQANWSTITISIASAPQVESAGTDLSDMFYDSGVFFANSIMLLVQLLIYLLPWGLLVGVILFIVYLVKNAKHKDKEIDDEEDQNDKNTAEKWEVPPAPDYVPEYDKSQKKDAK